MASSHWTLLWHVNKGVDYLPVLQEMRRLGLPMDSHLAKYLHISLSRDGLTGQEYLTGLAQMYLAAEFVQTVLGRTPDAMQVNVGAEAHRRDR